MTALPLECQSAFDATVELLRHPMVGDALMKLTVDNMIVDKRTSAILRICAYHEMPWVGVPQMRSFAISSSLIRRQN